MGISLWLGLVFASAFYLAGFGHYAISLLRDMGLELGSPSSLAILTAVILLVVAIAGTEKTGILQNGILAVLIVILLLLLSYGLLQTMGVKGQIEVPDSFAPKGYMPIFPTAALVFTSYLGFA